MSPEESPARRFWGAPRPPREVESRARIRALIEDALDAVPGVLVVGPTGSGRSTALADWAAHTVRPGKGIWFQVEGATSTRQPFWMALLNVLHGAGVIDAEAHHELNAAAATAAGLDSVPLLLSHVIEECHEPVMIVVDQGELIREMQIALDLSQFVHYTANVSVLATGASLIGAAELVMPPHRVRVIDAQQLALDAAECQLLVQDTLGPDAVEIAEAIFSATAGWPDYVQTLVNSLVGVPPAQWRERMRARLSAYLDQRVAQVGISQDGLRFVAVVSLAEFSDTSLASRLMGVSEREASRIFHSLMIQGMGLLESHPAPITEVFRFTPVLAPFLASRQAALSCEERTQAHSVIADWMLAAGHRALAFVHLVSAERYDDAEGVLDHSFAEVFTLPLAQAAAVLEPVSHHVMAGHPLLQFARGVLRNSIPETAIRAKEDLAGAAITAARQWYSATGLRRASLGVVIIVVSRLTGRWSAIEEVLPVLESTVESLDEVDPGVNPVVGLLIRGQISLTLLRTGNFTRSAAVAHRVLSYPDLDVQAPILVGQLRGIVAFQYAVAGDLEEARTTLRTLSGPETLPSGWMDSYIGVHARLAQAILALEEGDAAEADRFLQKVEQHYPMLEHWPEALLTRAWQMVSAGDTDAALAFLTRRGTQLARHTPCSPLIRERLYIDAVLIATLAGNQDYTVKRLRTLPKSRPLVIIARALGDLYSGLPERGLGLSSRLAPEPLPLRIRLLVQVITAGAQWLTGDRDEAVRTYQRALGAAAIDGVTSPPRLLPRDISRALNSAFVQRVQPGLVERNPQLVELWGKGLGVPVENTGLLTGRERQVLELLADGSSAARIAQMLGTSLNTVKTQRRALYRKLNATSREQALTHARQMGLLGSRTSGTASSH